MITASAPSNKSLEEERALCVKVLQNPGELRSAYQLRFRTFVEELKWTTGHNGMEINRYDPGSISLGVTEAGRLVSYLRVILPDRPFMLEEIFSELMDPDYKVRKEKDTVEISRLCVSGEQRGSSAALTLLFRGLYHWCLDASVRFLYIVVKDSVYRMLRARGVRCREIGMPMTMPDGIHAMAAIIDIREIEAISSRKYECLFRKNSHSSGKLRLCL